MTLKHYVKYSAVLASLALGWQASPLLAQASSAETVDTHPAAAKVAVVVVNSIGDAVPHDLGVDLFNKWGIGRAQKDNGLLVLLVMDQRSIEFITGKGTEGVLPDILCKKIQENYMVPYAKENNFDQCVISGIEQVVRVIEDPENANYLYESPQSLYTVSEQKAAIYFLMVIFVFYWIILLVTVSKRFKKKRFPPVLQAQSKSYVYTKILLLNIGVPLAWMLAQLLNRPFALWQNAFSFMVG